MTILIQITVITLIQKLFFILLILLIWRVNVLDLGLVYVVGLLTSKAKLSFHKTLLVTKSNTHVEDVLELDFQIFNNFNSGGLHL